jgi:16S rRNA (cytosine967-C5)-methyltransferase
MRDTGIVDRLRLAREAMVLVSQGTSERSAVSKVAASTPTLRREKSSALALVIDAVARQDLLDLTIERSFHDAKIDRKSLGLFRLATHLLLANTHLSKGDVVWGLRRISSDSENPRLERLFGSIVANGMPTIPSTSSEDERIGFRTHNPPWWVSYCIHSFGRETALKILSALDRPRYVRVNPLRNRGRSAIPIELKNYSDHFSKVEPGVFRLDASPSMLSGYFESGLFQMQDLASFLAVKAADPAPGEKVLDLCAAPGGKTATLAQMMRNRGAIVSVDYSRNRMVSWNRETSRLGVRIASPLIGDASNLGLHEEFDLVLIDPPCSGTGILDRNPRMKWHLSPKLVQKFSLLQSRVLEEASRYTQEGGRILYCTCSLTLEENEQVVSRFLASHSNFETRPVLGAYGSRGLRGLDDCRRFYPHKDRTAGYFIARLERASQV